MDEAELELQTASTLAFIMADADEITLIRKGKISDGAGGFIHDEPRPLAAQLARLIPQSDQVREIDGEDGVLASPEYVVLMEPDADIKRYDIFEWRGDTWEVAQVHTKPDYELKGDVIRRGA